MKILNQKLEAPLDEGEGLDMAVVKIALSFVPIIGGAIAEFVGYHGNNLARRQEFWMAQVTDAINVLQRSTGHSVDNLMKNEAFFSFLLQATPVALRNHQKEKIFMLRNALVSVGQPSFSDDDMAFQFLRYIDELSVSHLKILRAVFEHPGDFAEVKSMEQAFGQLALGDQSRLSKLVVRTYLRDLDTRGLVNASDLEDLPEFESKAVYIAAEQSDRHPLHVTELGAQFLAFIEVGVTPWQASSAVNTSVA